MEPSDNFSGQRTGVDKRVSMLASVINRATGLKPGNFASTSNTRFGRLVMQLRASTESKNSKRDNQPAFKAAASGQDVELSNMVTSQGTSSMASLPVPSNNRQDNYNPQDPPWESFGDNPLPRVNPTPAPTPIHKPGPSVETRRITSPPPPPPPQQQQDKASVSVTSLEVEQADLPDNSIGTQTEKFVLIDETSKTGSRGQKKTSKTKSFQIDFSKGGRGISLFSRSRSLTPTRYKALKEEGKPETPPTKAADKGKNKGTNNKNVKTVTRDEKKKGEKTPDKSLRRAQSLSPVRRRTKKLSNGHQPRERIIKAKSQTQLKEIKPRTVIVREQPATSTIDRKAKRTDAKSSKDKVKKEHDKTDTKSSKEKKTEKKTPEPKSKTAEKKPKGEEASVNLDESDTKKTADKDKAVKNKSEKLSKLSDGKKTDKMDKDKKQDGDEKKEEKKKPDSPKDIARTVTGDKSKETIDEIVAEKPEAEQKVAIANEGKEILQSVTVADDVIREEDETEETETKDEKDIAQTDNMDKIEKVDDGLETAAKKKKEKLITEEDNAEKEVDLGMDVPPGDEDLEDIEELLARQKDGEDDIEQELDPDLVRRTEDQIFTKIKFYKNVIDEVRLKPWTYRKKIKLLKEAKEYTARFEGKLSGEGGGPSQIAQLKAAWHKASREISNYLALMVPWEGRIRHIESYFGGVVASYFTFLRWIFWTNIVQAALMACVVMVPEVMFGPDWGTVEYKSIPVNETEGAAYLKTAWDFEGYVKYSPLFYGYYSSIKKFSSGYRMPLAYLFANLAQFAYSFVAILRQIAANAKDEKATDKDDNFTFAWKTFASWDYMIGNEETAKNKFKSVVLAIRESITEQKEAKKKISKKRKALRVFANCLVVMVLAGSTYAIYLTVDRSREFEKRVKELGPDSVTAWERNEVSVVMSIVTSFFPILFDMIANLEDYHPRVALQWSLGRIMVLYLLNLYTLYIALFWKIQDIEKNAEEANTTYYAQFNHSHVTFCSQITTIEPFTLINHNTNMTTEIVSTASVFDDCTPDFVPEVTCWETMVGQELFKLTMFDMVTTIAVIYGSEFFRAVFVKNINRCWCWDLEKGFPGYATFSLAENLLHLIYNQGMIWMGTLFSPGLPGFNLIKLLALFYVRAWSVMVCNVPEERIFKAGSDNFYLLLLLFMLYVVMIPIAFAMVSIRPSTSCGPFRNVQYMYLALTEWMEEAFSSGVNNVFSYISSPGALIPIFVLLFLILYYLKSTNEALKGAVLDLKKQLNYERTEGKKKVFSMADAGKDKDAKAKNGGTSNIGVGLAAAKALGKMRAGTRSQASPSLSVRTANGGQPTMGNASLGGVMAATQFLAKMKQRAAQSKNTIQIGEGLPPGLNV